jgi:3-dehydroquinate dehydratase/shikimate dehydrogenase
MDSSHKPRVCISICEPTVARVEHALAAAAAVCNLIEVRLDCLDPVELEHGANQITKMLADSACDLILTFRPAEQGGRRTLDIGTRYVFWAFRNLQTAASLVDIELDLAEGFNSSESLQPVSIDWSRVICSHHDYVGVPADLAQLYDRMFATPARILKIAVQADDAIDSLPIFRLLERARSEGREMIAIAMGDAGILTRILGPSRGAFLTYASLESETATAPGQITARQLRDVYRLEHIDQQTQIFGIVGMPVSHSVSPYIHNAAFAATGVNAVFIPFAVCDLKAFMKRMIRPHTRELDWNLRGLSVTAPHKSSVMEHLDWIEPAAQQIGAVNTIVIENDALQGYNTDARGFIIPLSKNFGDLRDARCAVLGAGGAAKAAVWALKEAGAKVTIFARDETKGRLLAERFGTLCMKLEDSNFEHFDVVINATPLGTAGHLEAETPAGGERLRGARLAYDLVYNPTETRFLREARDAGCETLGGLAMLIAQAVEQFRLWTGKVAPSEVMSAAARRRLMPEI